MALTHTKHPAVICAHCRRLRTASGRWVLDTRPQITRTLFVSHGICPECMERLFPEFCGPPTAAERQLVSSDSENPAR